MTDERIKTILNILERRPPVNFNDLGHLRFELISIIREVLQYRITIRDSISEKVQRKEIES
jgi:hypothetical protein